MGSPNQLPPDDGAVARPVRIVVVDGDPLLHELLSQALPLLNRRFVVTAAPDVVIRGLALPSVLQVLATEVKSGLLRVEAHGETGSLALAAGRVVDAETVRGRGREALFEMLSWREPVLVLEAGKDARSRTIDESLTALLLEAAVRLDQGALASSGS